MKITNNKFNISLAIGIFFIITAWLLLAPELSNLKKIEGAIISVEPKKNGVGAFIKLRSPKDDEYLFNASHLNHFANNSVRSFRRGEVINVWYSDSIKLKNGSYEVWQIYRGNEVIVAYDDLVKTNKIYSYIFLILGVASIVLAVAFKLKARVK